MKRFFVSALAFLLVLMSVVSCAKSGETEETTAQTTVGTTTESQTTAPAPEEPLPPAQEEEKVLTFVADGKSDYVIIYPKFDTTCKTQAEQLQGWIEKAYGVKLPVSDDIAATNNEDACEILVGKTNRVATTQVSEKLGREQDYACCVVGNKLVLLGFSSSITQKAVNSFYASYLSNVKDATKPMEIPATLYRVVEGSYGVSVGFCAGKPLAKFNIVYPKSTVNGEQYLANQLKAHLKKGKMELGIKTDAVTANTKEIRIGVVNRLEKETAAAGEFTVSVKNGNLHIVANDFLGYLAAETYLTKTLFGANTAKDILQEGFRYTGKVVSNAPAQTAEYRVMFQNIWGVGEHIANRDDFVVAMVMDYSPDVVGFNEYYNNKMDDAGTIKQSLTANGYAKAPAGNRENGQNGESVLYYKTSTMKLLEDKFVTFQVKSPTTGSVSMSSVAAHIGVFESKQTGDRFIAIAVHYESNWQDGFNSATGSDFYVTGCENRKNQVDTLMSALEPLQAKYGNLGIVMGGDYNSPATGRTATVKGEPNKVKQEDACEYLIRQYGWKDCHSAAEKADNDSSTHGYPVYDSATGTYVKGNYDKNGTYPGSIDHIFQHGDSVESKVFDTLTDDFTTVISDHSPVMLDFNIK